MASAKKPTTAPVGVIMYGASLAHAALVKQQERQYSWSHQGANCQTCKREIRGKMSDWLNLQWRLAFVRTLRKA